MASGFSAGGWSPNGRLSLGLTVSWSNPSNLGGTKGRKGPPLPYRFWAAIATTSGGADPGPRHGSANWV
jgi:hypothetical protein